MARTALAYEQPLRSPKHDPWPEQWSRQQPAQRPQRRPDRPLQVLPGKGVQPQHLKALSTSASVLFAVAFVVVIIIGAIWIARVSLTEATMSVMAHSEKISANIAAERLAGTRLEVEYSKASSSAAIQFAATNELGMSADEQIEYLRIVPGE